MATIVLVFAGLALAFTVPIAKTLVNIFRGGAADWDPRREKLAKDIAIGIAVTAFYALDFALNALQASLRNLVLDVTPGEQLQAANAWHGRFNHVGNVVGFAMVAIVAGTILPYLAARDHRLLKPESEKVEEDSDSDSDDEDRELTRIQEMVRQWKAEAAREGRPLKLPTSASSRDLSGTKVHDPNPLIISAVHAQKHMDMLTIAVRRLDVYDLLHKSSLAGELGQDFVERRNG
ncbi:hypothetical protein QFC19_003019 [Naganishia cerealis]|uniref:Uncharacterized protein n=1 Tax=Naganishia cerealis TaxID=610337 RepID=A0ACC2W6H0_9TREE|nr:hypothetical protein QFC19_003019 [Naganishia cerealis]